MGKQSGRVLVTGANGQLGRSLQAVAENNTGFEFHFLGREHCPVDNHALTRQVIASIRPDIIINTAAYTAVDKAEHEADTAMNINGYAVGNLAKIAGETGAAFFHISTDYVFDGKASQPYKEDAATAPLSVYGKSKLLGEQLALSENPASVIVRTSWVYSRYGHNFVKTMLRLMQERSELNIVNDQWGSPTYAGDLAEVLLQIAGEQKPKPGIYHFSNAGGITWFTFAAAIKEIKGYSCRLSPVTTSEYPVPAKRPAYSVMNCTKISEAFGVRIKPWREVLAGFLKGY